jgi:hypothetical protein
MKSVLLGSVYDLKNVFRWRIAIGPQTTKDIILPMPSLWTVVSA